MNKTSFFELVKVSLETSYGFRPPRDFVDLVITAIDQLGDRDPFTYEWYDCLTTLSSLFDLQPDCTYDLYRVPIANRNEHEWRSYVLPPEFFSFGTDGGGSLYGYVVHAPEVSSLDYPCGRWYTGDASLGVVSYGNTTSSAIRRILLENLKLKENDATRRQAYLIGDILGFSLDGWDIVDEKPQLLNGWKHVASADGVGVLARAELFSKERVPVVDVDEDITSVIDFANNQIESGFPATALLSIRETQHRFPTIERMRELADVWILIYHALNRRILADAIKRTLE
jgi:hypothetical protein